MRKTPVYLSDELKRDLERLSAESGRSEADLIREGITSVVVSRATPHPRIPLFDSGDPTFAERVDELLAQGFGKD